MVKSILEMGLSPDESSQLFSGTFYRGLDFSPVFLFFCKKIAGLKSRPQNKWLLHFKLLFFNVLIANVCGPSSDFRPVVYF